MKRIMILVVISGCAISTANESSFEMEDDIFEAGHSKSFSPREGGGNHGASCLEVISIVNRHGETEIIIPGFCNPRYIYMGYPDPSDRINDPLEEIYEHEEIYE